MSNVDPRLQVFIDLFNLVYPNWEIYGRSDRDLQPQHVDFDTNLQTYHGRCGPRIFGKIYYRVNASKWAEWDWPRRLQLVIHEMAHTQHTDHSPAFWEETAQIYHRLHTRSSKVDRIVGEEIDWDATAEHLVTNPTNNMVDNRVETAYERQLKLADSLGYPQISIPLFNGMNIAQFHRCNGNQEISVSVSDVTYEEFPVKQLARYFRSPRRSGIEYRDDVYFVLPPQVVEKNGGYRVVEGDERLGIARHAIGDDDQTVRVELVDSAPVGSGGSSASSD
ncbi:YgjP-like metallopeptidase domain-containing protein [Natrarchaeobaculum sulfurireducens]|uniref:YgjP-like metallopeptidase domain-containing protein n=1 Tax=Natrarchaeobaculum sulfurireducens TaxID=2044521 RepID=UPI000E3D561D|nr:YgjP-like metallopeptidase domain-containing protein [Natrarchaeobaculum sulfurireducens]